MDNKEIFYDAFISYRHTEVDAAIAHELHGKLEHFHIPKKIQQSFGKKRINRIFRDKEELPLSSDLSDSILTALDHSEFLIVICSKAACESKWVLREIEYFIKVHDREHVLALLVDDEPEEAFPKPLRFRKKM